MNLFVRPGPPFGRAPQVLGFSSALVVSTLLFAQITRAEGGDVLNTTQPVRADTVHYVELEALAPAEGLIGHSSLEMTPMDLVELTNASDVYARDYFNLAGDRIGGVLLIETRGEIYEHSKAVRDRAAGASLSDMFISRIGGHDILRTTLKRPNEGISDHSATFSIHEEHTDEGAGVYWLISDDPSPAPDARVIRVQTWANTPGAELALAREVIARAEFEYAKLALTGAEASRPSRAFRSGRTLGGDLYLTLDEFTDIEHGEFSLRLIGLNEDARTQEVRDIPLLSADADNVVQVDIQRMLDVTVELVHHGEVQDRIWLSDGTWAAYDDSMWSGSAEVTFSRQACTPRRATGELGLAGCASSQGSVQGEAGFAGVARHMARPLDLSTYNTVKAYVDSEAEVRLCVQTSEGGVFCDTISARQDWVSLSLSGFSDLHDNRLSRDAQVEVFVFTVEQPGAMKLEVAGLELLNLEGGDDASSPNAGGCSIDPDEGFAGGGAAWLTCRWSVSPFDRWRTGGRVAPLRLPE